jgi:hypothetical protein
MPSAVGLRVDFEGQQSPDVEPILPFLSVEHLACFTLEPVLEEAPQVMAEHKGVELGHQDAAHHHLC